VATEELTLTDVLGTELTLPNGSSTVILGVLMALVLILRPSGITRGREVSLPRRRRDAGTGLTFDQVSGTVTGRVDER
jgi:hypothetical protein